jgi:PAS domain S-box-containing protein
MGDQEVFAPLPGAAGSEATPGTREDRFRQIADALEAFALHEDGRLLYVNQTLSGLLGYRREELLGKAAVPLITAPASRALVHRQLGAGSPEPCEALLVRRDGTVFPAEISTRPLTDVLRLSLVRDLSSRRRQQAALRLHQAGLQIEGLSGLGQAVRVLADELEDMGLPSAAVSLHLIDEAGDRLTTFTACPESRGARSYHNTIALKQALELHPPLRRLVSHWRRRRVWEREPDADLLQFLRRYSGLGETYAPRLLVDVPFEQGTLSAGLVADQPVRTQDMVAALQELALPLRTLLKRLLQVEAVLAQLNRSQGTALPGAPGDAPLDFVADPDSVQAGQAFFRLSSPQRDLARAFLRRLGEEARPPDRGRARGGQEKS